ncbi:hypothetical protein H257_02160 [Aphanomyces astaci]|uniref:COMM domain-containing protein n=1 Tax=Aphanomyces astaci TaxID=112090 RepID=W4H5A9_APHAT|nr:hypothetical protein H257_02160 [Aphanomyces astaci]ETV87185.1 hypothetical protein H257_02160 [Aphanomyces astaci]|eukprot:XP_009823984.1 hypothetical protein H257_02160 [Aphanomyces astaci]
MATNVNAMAGSMQEEFATIIFKYSASPKDNDLGKLAHEFAALHNINLKPLKKTIQHVLELLNHAIQQSQPTSEFVEHLTHAGMDLAPAKLFATKWEHSRAQLLQRTHQVMLSSNKLVNLTWKVGITSATNLVPELGATYVQLRFELDSTTETIELSVESFYRFLANMEALQAHMHFLMG